MSDCTCTGMNAEISFRREGLVIQRWLRLCDDMGTYWGGWTIGGDVQGLHHMTVNEHWMFRQIAQFAHEPGAHYELCGHGYTTFISTRMEAERIAGPVACDVRRVRHFFALSVEVPEPDEVTV